MRLPLGLACTSNTGHLTQHQSVAALLKAAAEEQQVDCNTQGCTSAPLWLQLSPSPLPYLLDVIPREGNGLDGANVLQAGEQISTNIHVRHSFRGYGQNFHLLPSLPSLPPLFRLISYFMCLEAVEHAVSLELKPEARLPSALHQHQVVSNDGVCINSLHL